jgi:hypothetical protein
MFVESRPIRASESIVFSTAALAVRLSAALLIYCSTARGQTAAPGPVALEPPQFGPYNGTFVADGPGLRSTIPDPHDPILLAESPWTMYCWVSMSEAPSALELVAGIGSITAEYARYLALDSGKVVLWMGGDNVLAAPVHLGDTEWHLLAATFDGAQFRLYADGRPLTSGTLTLGRVSPMLQMAPVSSAAALHHFNGKIASFSVLRHAVSADEIRQLAAAKPDFSTILFDEGSKPWPLQTRGQAGYRAPQDPTTMPRSRAPFSKPVAIKRPPVGASLVQTEPGTWTFSDGWSLREAPKVDTDGARLSTATYDAGDWMRATVPGTVLTTLVDNGIYPDPDYGLNNLAIPESLNKQDYWYRNEFTVPASALTAGSHAELTFQGINYAAAVWLNGKMLGETKGAFRRGNFDVTGALKPGEKNVLAVRISPPPHPGIPQEQSILGGPGENGGAMVIDGPTFVATEGWDWVPAIRDRDSGIWQPVTLHITGALKIRDAQIVSRFAHHDMSRAALDMAVPVTNLSPNPVQATITASIEEITVRKSALLPPGDSVVKLSPAEFPQLNLDHPRLWWPNGYGKPELYQLKLTVDAGGAPSDTGTVRFGIREISYELSLLDSRGHLRRVNYTPAESRDFRSVVNVTHEGIRDVPAPDPENVSEERRGDARAHVASLYADGEKSAAVETVEDVRATPYLILRVNGVRIAARGGNWGMDDARKRVSRQRLEPYFRLHRDAGLNIIRNWVGQSTEQVFYDLADEYGLLVWNDFWESTQNYNMEAEDPELFLENAADTIAQFRNHPSIAVWCGRNEGVPQPVINEGLDDLVRKLDGTRYYSPSSNEVNLQGSGPYKYQDPARYYTVLNRGFSVETGTPSFSTLESFETSIPKEDQWPLSDAWAYHDWHQSAGGDVAPFMAELEAEFGAATSLADFERKAQMLNYVSHRAIFEGMDANLWAPNGGRLLWMTQPAWPSNMWQILSSDYDTQASYYGVKKACEPLHVQLNLATYAVDVVNTTTVPHPRLTVSAKVYTVANELITQSTQIMDVAADATTPGLRLDLGPTLARGVVFVKLELRDPQNTLVSDNLYWLGPNPASYRALTHLAPVQLHASATATATAGMAKVTVQLINPMKTAALENKLTLVDAKTGERILPAYYSDNYISLLPGESRTITIEYPGNLTHGPAAINLRGWNAIPQTVPVH